MLWSCADTNTVNVTRIGEDLSTVGPVYLGSDDRRPRFLALHPAAQLLFVSVAGQFSGEEGGDRIDRVQLSSGAVSPLVNTSIGAVSGMTVDWSDQGHLYWADIVNKKIEAVSVGGGERRVVVSEGMVEVVGLAVEQDWLYWADRDQGVIVRVDKITGTQRQVVLSKVSRLSSLSSVAWIDPSVLSQNPCSSGQYCSHFCSFTAAAGVTCGCPPGLSLGSDNVTCGHPPTCQPTEFTCLSRGVGGAGPACIPSQWRCDGQSECADRSDELDCPECGAGQFRCQSGECVASSGLCDGTPDCEDGTDETLCCPQGQFQCAVTGECVQSGKLCDGEHDCGDSSDELPPKCSSVSSQSSRRPDSEASTATTSTYLIAVFAGLISLCLLSLIVAYCRRKHSPLTTGLEEEITQLAAGSKEVVTAGAATLERGRAVGAEVPGQTGSSNGVMYDRSHLTGASSTAGTSSSGQQGGAGPPPSPATSVATKLSRLVPSSKISRQHRQATFNSGLPTSYRYYTQHRGAPPCTPCSTDANEESDSLAYSAFQHRPHFPSRAGSVVQSRTGYESESFAPEELPSLLQRGHYAPPPSTPLYLSDYGDQELSPPASPNTERSFFLNPCIPGPPPSPVPGPPPPR